MSQSENEASETGRRNFYGRVHGKTLRPSQKALLEQDLPRLMLPEVSRHDNPTRVPIAVPPGTWLEVGFGGGEHLVHLAASNPERHIIGCEPFVNGIAMLLAKLRDSALVNVVLHPGDVRDLLDVLPAGSLNRVYLNYPDPWPKAKHHRRRFVTPEYLRPLHRAMESGGELRIATDIPDYVRQAHEELPGCGFALARDGATPFPGWTRTRYEAKALREGRSPQYMVWRRV